MPIAINNNLATASVSTGLRQPSRPPPAPIDADSAPATAAPQAAAETIDMRQLERLLVARRDSADDSGFQPQNRHSQQALQTFLQNRPSIEDQLGVEIVGVDTFA